jgi:large subunit ribosomal protein L10
MMKKISVLFKEISENRIRNSIKESDSVFIIKYSGLSSPDMSALRQSLSGKNASLFVVRNSVAKRSFKETKLEGLIKYVDGPCGLIFIKDEPVGVSRVICDFVRDHEKLKLEGGFLKDRFIEKKDIEALSKIPSKEVLRAQLVMVLNSPIFGLAMVLNQTLRKFVYCLEQIRQKKDTSAS